MADLELHDGQGDVSRLTLASAYSAPRRIDAFHFPSSNGSLTCFGLGFFFGGFDFFAAPDFFDRVDGTLDMPETWKQAFNRYKYPVDLRDYTGAREHPGWFDLNMSLGNPDQTRAFETRFRQQAPFYLEAWAEVVYWKLYFRRGIAAERATELLCSGTSPRALWSSCNYYIENRDRQAFKTFRKLLFKSPVVAVAATFPAFICPDEFPMVDTQIAEWTGKHGPDHAYRGDVNAVPDGNIQDWHWPFVESWIEWCRATAGKLSQRTGFEWRARDVEMAVWTAQRSNPPLKLNKLT